MEHDVITCSATIDGLSKKESLFTFLLCTNADFNSALAQGNTIEINEKQGIVRNLDDEYISISFMLDELVGTSLAELVIGSTVTLRYKKPT